MEIFNSRRITNIGVVAAIYVVVTLLGSGLAYGQVQFRVSEALVLLCFFNKDYILSMSIGCFIANLFSTVGLIDTVGRRNGSDGDLRSTDICMQEQVKFICGFAFSGNI